MDTQLQANQGVDHAFLMEGFKLATERNGGVEPPHSPPVTLQQGAGALLVGVLGDYTGESEHFDVCSQGFSLTACSS